MNGRHCIIRTRNPPAVACRGVRSESVRRSASEVTLGANLQRNRILVLELIDRGGLWSGGPQHRGTGELLVEVEPHDFSRERQILDRSPAGNHTELRDVEVGVAGEIRGLGTRV